MEGSGRHERIAQNETTFRRVNEALEPPESDGRDVAGYVCECGRIGCTDTIALTRDEYEAVRTSFDRFLLVPGHEEPDVDEVVERYDDYDVVVKQPEKARNIADEDDPRADEVTGR